MNISESMNNRVLQRLDEAGLAPKKTADLQNSALTANQLFTSENVSSVELSNGTWALLQDTTATSGRTVTLVQIEESKLDGLIARLTDLKTAVDGLSLFDEGSSDYNLVASAIDSIENSLSDFLGDSILQKSATVQVESGTPISITNYADFVSNEQIIGFDGEPIEIARIEISESDFLNAYHFPDGCPICSAQQAMRKSESFNTSSGGLGPDYNSVLTEPDIDESAETAGTNVSPGSAATTASGGGADYVDPLIGGTKWNLTAGETVSYSYYDGSVAYGSYTGRGQPDFPGAAGAFNATQVAEMDDVYSLWSNYAPFRFEKVTEDPSGNIVGDLRVAYMTDTSLSSAQAFAYYPSSTFVGGDTWYNLDGVQHVNGNPGDSLSANLTFSDGYGRITALHEIGHSIGLSHPFAVNGTAESSTGETLTGNGLVDDMRTTVMSYTNSVNNRVYYLDNGSITNKQIYSMTPGIYDVAAVEYLYGAITDTNLGNTTYSITDHQQIQTIVDSGGTDTLDLSATLHRSIVDLTPGSLSSIGYATESEQEAYWATQGFSLAAVQSAITSVDLFDATDNLGIAFNTTIENVIGSAGNDQITGNTANNSITGNGGNDTIDGGGGTNTAVFNGNISEYTITDNGDGTHTVTDNVSGRDGVDTLSNIATFQFADAGYNVSSGSTFGDANYRGGSNGGGTSNVYYSAFNRIDFGSRVMAPHEIAELKELLFNSVGDVSDLIEEALQTFVNQRESMANVLDRLGGSITTVGFATEDLGLTAALTEAAAIERQNASERALDLKQQIVRDAGQALQAQTSPLAKQVNNLLV
jgi:hypothetical protein